MFYVIGVLVWALIWGFATRSVVYNKGYDENWFWWGFFFGFIAFIVALTKADASRNYTSYSSSSSSYKPSDYSNSPLLVTRESAERDMEILNNGGWKCKSCGKMNERSSERCVRCGWKAERYVTQDEVAEIVKEESNTQEKNEPEKLEILKKYKELLDMGAISEDEFETKKKELLYNTDPEVKEEKPVKDTEEKEPEEETSWFCANCDKENDLERTTCRWCGAIREYDTPKKVKKKDPNLADWLCPNCNTINKCFMGMCKCGTLKKDGKIIIKS